MNLEKQNWIASHDALTKKEKDELFQWLEKNAEKKVVNGVTTYSVPVLRMG